MGLQFTASVLDVPTYLSKEYAPAEMVERNGALWLVRQVPIDHTTLPSEQSWSWCSQSDWVRVPLIPYCSKADATGVLVAYAFELGARAMSLVPSGYELLRFHISTSHQVDEATLEGQPVFRAWLGFGLVLREKKK